jgi:uncharacterized membrane protein
MLLNVETFFGRFHPLIVHLPIGFLLLAVFFYLLSQRKEYKGIHVAVPASLLIGSLGAAFACITGYVLSLNGNYDEEILNGHLRLGIITTIISFLAYFISIKKMPLVFFRSGKMLVVLLVLIFILINFTGHLGGTLTHGGDYLSTAVLFNKQEAKKKMIDINDAYVFKDLVKPILAEKCVSCHNNSKKNGGLSVETYGAMLKGGKHGPGIQPGNLSGSEIIKRISLLPKSKKFMPANGRTPLTWQETEVLRWWIEKVAADRDRKLSELHPPAAMTSYAAAYFGTVVKDASSQYAAVNIKAPPVRKEIVEQLKQSGFYIKYLNYKPDILDITLPPSDSNRNIGALLKSLVPVKENILWLNVAGNSVSDNEMSTIGQFINLERLRLDANPITDKGLQKLFSLPRLQSLNLGGTKVTKDGVSLLSGITSLRNVYVWNSGMKKEDVADAKFPFKIIASSDVQAKPDSARLPYVQK